MRLLVFLVLFSLPMAVLSGCDDDPVAQGEPLYVRTALSTFDEDTDLYVGEYMFLDLMLVNEGPRSVTLEFPDSCLMGFEIIQDDKVLVRFPRECGGGPRDYELRTPGFHFIGFAFSTMDEIPNADWLLDKPSLPPGTYTLRAGLLVRPIAIPWAKMEFTVREWQARRGE